MRNQTGEWIPSVPSQIGFAGVSDAQAYDRVFVQPCLSSPSVSLCRGDCRLILWTGAAFHFPVAHFYMTSLTMTCPTLGSYATPSETPRVWWYVAGCYCWGKAFRTRKACRWGKWHICTLCIFYSDAFMHHGRPFLRVVERSHASLACILVYRCAHQLP